MIKSNRWHNRNICICLIAFVHTHTHTHTHTHIYIYIYIYIYKSRTQKQHHDTIHFSRNMKMAYFTICHSRQKRQYEYFSVFGCQAEDRFVFILMKTKHSVHIIVFGMVTNDGDAMAPFIFASDSTQRPTSSALEEVLLA